MRRIISQARKELTQLVRDRLALALALVLPLILLFLLSTAISLTVHNLPLVIQDMDDSTASRQLADAFRASVSFHVVSWPPDQSPEKALRANAARGVLIIPQHFERDLARGGNPEVQVLVDATDSNTARIVQGYSGEIVRAFNQAQGQQSAGLVHAQMRFWFNPGRNSPRFYSPGVLVMGISMFPALLAALAMAKEGEQKTILQVYVSSITAHEFLLGKILAFMVIAFCEWTLSMFALFTVFGQHRRSHAAAGLDRLVRVLCGQLRHLRGSRDSQPGRRDPSGVTGGILVGVPALRIDFSGGEHSSGIALGLQHRVGEVLHHHRARRAAGGRRMAGCLVFRVHDRRARHGVLLAGVAEYAAHAGGRMNGAPKVRAGQRLGALIRKEFRQIRRDKRLAVSLILPPTLQLLLFGFALDSTVSHLRLGITDWSRTPESRELVSSFTESKSFAAGGYFLSEHDLENAISRGKLDAGIVVPKEFSRDLERGRPVDVAILLNAVNANTATIAQGYAEGLIQSYNQRLAAQGVRMRVQTVAASADYRGAARAVTAFLYNPGLVNAWFIVTGTFGVLVVLNGSMVAAAAMVKERERGTVEQLLMTPASPTEIVLSKIFPLFVVLMGMVIFAIGVMRVAFTVPARGNMMLVLMSASLCLLSGISIGTFIATFTGSAQQAQLTAFFVNPPLSVLSGSLTPVEAMPSWLQPVTWLNPIRHFGIIVRATLLKGSGMDVLWPNFLALIAFTVVLVSLSIWRFRKQLG
jgi:ABC-2 type transport system permease protein